MNYLLEATLLSVETQNPKWRLITTNLLNLLSGWYFKRTTAFYFIHAIFLVQDCGAGDCITTKLYIFILFVGKASLSLTQRQFPNLSLPAHSVPFPQDLIQHLSRDIASVILEVSLVTTADISNSKFKSTAPCNTLTWQTALHQFSSGTSQMTIQSLLLFTEMRYMPTAIPLA